MRPQNRTLVFKGAKVVKLVIAEYVESILKI